MQDRIPDPPWMTDYYGHAPFPGGRIVNRVALNGSEEPWTTPAIRHVPQRWLGPVYLRTQGVEFHVRYVGIHDHFLQGRYPLHTHPHAELLFTLSGQGSLHLPGQTPVESCTPGHLAVLPPACPHQSRWSAQASETWRVFVVDFDLAIDLDQVLAESGKTADLAFSPFYEFFFIRGHRGCQLAPEECRPALDIFGDLSRALCDLNYGVCSDILGGLLRLISLFSRGLRRTGQADGLHLAPPAISKEAALLKARTLMEQSEMLDAGCVDRIARTLGMSKSHFIREFKRAFGTTPKQYSLDVIMHRAVTLMSHTDVIIKEAAFHLGYEDPSSFSRAFHRYFGISPADYRLRHPPPPRAAVPQKGAFPIPSAR